MQLWCLLLTPNGPARFLKQRRVGAGQLSCVSGLDRHESPWKPSPTAPDCLSSMASSISSSLKQPASIFPFLHIESLSRGGGEFWEFWYNLCRAPQLSGLEWISLPANCDAATSQRAPREREGHWGLVRGDRENSGLFVPLPSVYKCRWLLEKHINETFFTLLVLTYFPTLFPRSLFCFPLLSLVFHSLSLLLHLQTILIQSV